MNNADNRQHKSVGVVLVNWNGGELTLPCIESLHAGSTQPELIVVVDNASTDGSSEVIEQSFPTVILIRNKENLGFTGGNNIGINFCIDAGMDYIWVLNNDTEVDRECLTELINFMNSNPGAAGCCGKILYDAPADTIWYAGATYDSNTLKSKHRGALEKDKGQYNNAEITPFITGCSMFVRRSAWQSVGLFDDIFFAYGEDLDWCIRSAHAKLSLWYAPQAIIYHKVSRSFTKKTVKCAGFTTPFMVKLVLRNRLFIINKYSSGFQKFQLIFRELIYAIIYLCGLLVLFRYQKVPAVWQGIHEGLTRQQRHI